MMFRPTILNNLSEMIKAGHTTSTLTLVRPAFLVWDSR
ncbi:hypothetical protein Nizo2776_2582 [Lactiplantibacillus plantarum]|nr:hypothetical protein Nizo2776_2582 [Lactiplantibacillus plantarum]